MSFATVPNIMARIQVATPESPIAVFYTPRREAERLDSVFADTVISRRRIRQEKVNLVGVYHKDLQLGLIQAGLYAALHQNSTPL